MRVLTHIVKIDQNNCKYYAFKNCCKTAQFYPTLLKLGEMLKKGWGVINIYHMFLGNVAMVAQKDSNNVSKIFIFADILIYLYEILAPGKV